MKILFLTQVLPYPLDAGPKVRAYYVLRYLAQQHSLTLVSFVRSTDQAAALEHLRQYCANLHTTTMPRSKVRDGYHLLRSLLNGEPFIIARDWLQPMATLLQQVIRDEGPFDAIHADQLWMAPYAQSAGAWQSQSHGQRPKLVLDQHNAVFMIPERLAGDDAHWLKRRLLKLEAHKMARYEVAACQAFDAVTWVTAEDYQAVSREAARQGQNVPSAGVIPICGDVTTQAPINRKPAARRITFVGGLHYPPNAQGICWFAREIFGQILAKAPDVVLTVIGKDPPSLLQQLGLPPANLAVTGFVEQVEPYLAETAVYIVPLLAGGGMRVKIIDGWRWGMPIVSTTIGAEGITAIDGQNISIADSPTAFAQAVLALLETPQKAASLAAAGRTWLETHYAWQTVYRHWDQIYCEA